MFSIILNQTLVNKGNTSRVLRLLNSIRMSCSVYIQQNYSIGIFFMYFCTPQTETESLYSKSYKKQALLESVGDCSRARSAINVSNRTTTVISSLGVNLIIQSLSDSFAIRIRVFSKYLIKSSGILTTCTSGVSSINLSYIYLSITNKSCLKVALLLYLCWLNVFRNV